AWVIYAGIIFFNGKLVIKNENLHDGFAVAELLHEYGFENGDKILTVNGKELEDAYDINKYLLLRNVKEVEVEHQGGTKETISIPDDIGHQLFANDVFLPFEPRVPAIIDTVIADYPAQKSGLLKGDVVKQINGKSINFWDEIKPNTIKGEENT